MDQSSSSIFFLRSLSLSAFRFRLFLVGSPRSSPIIWIAGLTSSDEASYVFSFSLNWFSLAFSSDYLRKMEKSTMDRSLLWWSQTPISRRMRANPMTRMAMSRRGVWLWRTEGEGRD